MLTLLSPSVVEAEDESDAQIRQRAEQILKRGEFRYLERFGQADGEGETAGQIDPQQMQQDADERRRAMEEAERNREWQQQQQREAQKQRNRWDDADLDPFDRGDSGSGSGAAGVLGTMYTGIAWAFLAVVIAAIVFLIVRAIANMDSNPKVSSSNPELNEEPADLQMEAPPGAVPADVYLDRAKRLAKSGKFREAVAHLLMGAMSNIERSGLLRFRQGLTLRDYLRAVRAMPPAHTSFRSMIRIYEPIGFGRRDATRKHFELTLAGYQEGFANALAVQNG